MVVLIFCVIQHGNRIITLSKKMLKASVIISMYKDVEALNSILYALSKQSISEFEVIIAEDGDDPQVAEFLNSVPYSNLQLVHITQDDLG
ncbi:glycosyl transferase, partial [Vibrio anguillarum]|nr:glycosyl transferase [Vibrio anguillarum]